MSFERNFIKLHKIQSKFSLKNYITKSQNYQMLFKEYVKIRILFIIV